MAINGEGSGDDVNTLGGSDDFGVSELQRIGEQFNRVPYSQREMRRRHKQANLEVNALGPRIQGDRDAIAAMESLLKATKIAEQRDTIKRELSGRRQIVSRYEKASETLHTLTPRLRIYRESTRERLNTQAVNTVAREFSESSINGYVSNSINGQEVQAAGLSMASQSSFEDLVAQRKAIMGQIGGLRSQSMQVAGSLIGGHGVDSNAQNVLQDNAAKIRELTSQLAPIAVAMRTQKALGEDPESRQRRVLSMGEKAKDIVDFDKLREQIRGGQGEFGNLSPMEMRKKETEAATNLVKALEELRGAAGKSKEEIAKLAKNAEQAADRFEEVQDASAAGAGNKSSIWQTTATVATAVGGIAQLAGQFFQVLGINQPMQQMSNVAGYASIENQKHDSWRSALAGNMTERLNLAGWNNAHAFGANRATYAGWKVASNIVGGAAGVVAGGAQIADELSNAPGGVSVGKVFATSHVVQGVSQGVLGMGEGALVGVAGTMDALGKISTSQAEIAGVNVTMDAVRKVNHIPGYQLQQYRDHIAGLYPAASYMGRHSDQFLEDTAGGGFMDNMIRYGIGSEEVGSLARFGAQNMGSMFNQNQILQSKRFENLGFGPADENMRRMAALSAGGTQNPAQTLEKLLEKAVSTGMDSSKAITMIAESTGSMAEQSALRGFADTGGIVGGTIMAAIDRSNPNEELATKKAVNAYQSGEQSRNNRAASWHGMVAVSRLQKQLGLNWQDAYALQGMSAAELRSLQGKSDTDIRNALIGRGVDGSYSSAFMGNLSGSLGSIVESKVLSQFEANGGMANGANTAWLNTIKPWLMADKKNAKLLASGNFTSLPKEIQEAASKITWTSQAGDASGDPMARLRDALATHGFLRADGTALGSGDLATGTGATAHLRNELTRGDRSKTKAASHALGQIDASRSGAAGIGAINVSGNVTEGMVGTNAETTWADAAAKSAASFGASAVRLDKASGKLTEAANALMAVAGISGLSGAKSNKNIVTPEVRAQLNKFEEWSSSKESRPSGGREGG